MGGAFPTGYAPTPFVRSFGLGGWSVVSVRPVWGDAPVDAGGGTMRIMKVSEAVAKVLELEAQLDDQTKSVAATAAQMQAWATVALALAVRLR